jgi:hypothetical protein
MRTIREEPAFRDQLQKLGVSPQRMDELLEGMSLTVATHPEIFQQVPGKELRRFRVIPFPGMPRMNVWFRYDEQYVDLVEIDVLEGSTSYDL